MARIMKETERKTKPKNGAIVSMEVERAQLPAVHHEPSVPDELSVEQLVVRVEKVHEVQKRVMKNGIHYGIIPGCEKPTLLKAGAEILALTFRLDAEFEHEKEFDGEHLTVYSTCTLYHAPTGIRAGSGKGACSTKETKYAYRHASRRCPECGKESVIKGKQEFGGGWLCWKKKDGCGCKFPDGDKQIESQPAGEVPNERIADCYNTVLKMADIRAHRAAILFTTAASDVFTQDMEEAEPGVDNGNDLSKQAKPTQSKPTPGPQWPQNEGGPPEQESIQIVPRGHKYERNAAHNHLEQVIEDYCTANNLSPDKEGLDILERMSSYETREGRKHPGVRDVLMLSEKEAIICQRAIQDTIDKNRNWRVELGQAIIQYCQDKKITKEEVLKACSDKTTIRDLDQPAAKKAFEKFERLLNDEKCEGLSMEKIKAATSQASLHEGETASKKEEKRRGIDPYEGETYHEDDKKLMPQKEEKKTAKGKSATKSTNGKEPEREKFDPKETALALIRNATKQNWNTVKETVLGMVKEIKGSQNLLDVTTAINNRQREIFSGTPPKKTA